MALDTIQKRGSVISVSLPWRQWLSEPAGNIDTEDRISLLKLVAFPESVSVDDGAVYFGRRVIDADTQFRRSIEADTQSRRVREADTPLRRYDEPRT